MKRLALFGVVLGTTLSFTTFAFPELIRHGYVSCTTCHVGPNGGGVLTPYGRQLSAEVLSTWSRPGEEKFMYGLFGESEKVALGGDARGIQIHRDTPTTRTGQYIWMQEELEGALFLKGFTFLATIGYEEQATFSESITARRHWVGYRFNDDWFMRAGKFQKAYGINVPDHVLVTKRGLRMDQGTDTYNVELSYITGDSEVFVTTAFGRPDKTELDREKGVALRGALNFKESMKVGASYYYASNDKGNRHVFGPYALLGLSKKTVIDFEMGMQVAGSVTGMAEYLKLQHEFFKGVNGYLTQEWLKSNFDSDRTLWEAYGVGVQFFPRPHLELNLQYQKQRIKAAEADFIDFASLLLHFYL